MTSLCNVQLITRINGLHVLSFLNGNEIRDQILDEVQQGVLELSARGVQVGLAAVLVGDNPASEIYVRNKIRACERVGIFSERITPGKDISTADLLAIIEELNYRKDIHGILVQLPLPTQIDESKVLLAVSPTKDVDGFHPVNVGALVTRQIGFAPCTPAGLIQILKRSNIRIAGKHAVILGRSNIVGKPAALLLLHENATVSICHSQTTDLAMMAREADILVVALGRPAMVTRDFIKPGAVVLDVGINRLQDAGEVKKIFSDDQKKLERFQEKGTVLVGDVHPSDVAEMASAYTPVPGGVGPLTIAMLLSNALEAARRISEN